MQAIIRNLDGYGDYQNYTYCHTRIISSGLDSSFRFSSPRGKYSSNWWLVVENEADEVDSQLPRHPVIDLENAG